MSKKDIKKSETVGSASDFHRSTFINYKISEAGSLENNPPSFVPWCVLSKT